jgi:hypothetical protein
LGFALVVVGRAFILHSALQSSVMASGRTVTEVAKFSPHIDAFWSLNPDHPSSYVYITYLIPVIVLVGQVFAVWALFKQPAHDQIRRYILMLLLLLGAIVILFLAMGPHMPFSQSVRMWETLVKLVPPYSMIRQSAKVLILLPALLSVLVVLPFSNSFPRISSPASYAICLALALLLLAEVNWRLDPTISLMDPEQKAYAAVVSDAQDRGEVARAVAIPLWPGDSHWSSINQYYGMKYRVRLLNGYRPRVPVDYIDSIFMRFVGLNRGYHGDDLLDALLEMGIRYIIVHEDAFPEKVSPFGIAETLRGFLESSRIRLLKQDRAVWAFEIMENASDANVFQPPWQVVSVCRFWDAERHVTPDTSVFSEEGAYHGAAARLQESLDALVEIPIWGIHNEAYRFSVRMRGQGTLLARFYVGDQEYAQVIEVDRNAWGWEPVPLAPFEGFQFGPRLVLSVVSGALDVDCVYLAKGEVPDAMLPGNVFRLPASTLFHAGYSDLDAGAVVFEPDLVPPAHILYGPKWPLATGQYLIRMYYQAAGDAQVGTIGFRYPAHEDNPDDTPVLAGKAYVEVPFMQRHNLPFTMQFYYNRSVPMRITHLEIERVE